MAGSRMNILFMGHRDRFAELQTQLRQSENHSVTYEEAPDAALIECFSKTGLYDWIIVGGQVKGLEAANETPDALQMPAREVLSDVIRGDYCSPQGANCSPCGISRSENGVLQLRCGRHQLFRGINVPERKEKYVGSDLCVFEYQAPCKKS